MAQPSRAEYRCRTDDLSPGEAQPQVKVLCCREVGVATQLATASLPVEVARGEWWNKLTPHQRALIEFPWNEQSDLLPSRIDHLDGAVDCDGGSVLSEERVNSMQGIRNEEVVRVKSAYDFATAAWERSVVRITETAVWLRSDIHVWEAKLAEEFHRAIGRCRVLDDKLVVVKRLRFEGSDCLAHERHSVLSDKDNRKARPAVE
jgi:hypothetical protein